MFKLKRIRWDENGGAAKNAQRELPASVTAYFTGVREALAGNPKPSDLHQLRLLTKRLRYTLELFRPCYGPGLRARISGLRRLQRCLGEITDCATAGSVAAACSRKNSRSQAQLKQFLRQRRAEKIAEFRREWTEMFDAPGREQWWTGYLARHVRGK